MPSVDIKSGDRDAPIGVVVRLEAQLDPPLEADVLGTLAVAPREDIPSQARRELEDELRKAAEREAQVSDVRVVAARGSVIVFVLLSVLSGLIGNAAYDLARRLARRLREVFGRWLQSQFGQAADLDAEGFISAAPTAPAPAPSMLRVPWDPVVLLALISHLTLAFVVVWLVIQAA